MALPLTPATTQLSAPVNAQRGSLPVSAVDRHHEEYDAISTFYSMIGPLYRGGYELQQHAAMYLRKRPVEPPAVFLARCLEFTYQNILQSGIGWYQTGLYADAPDVFVAEEGTGKRLTDGTLDDFLSNADRCGHSLVECSKQWLTDASLNGAAYVLIDLPTSTIASNFRQQKQNGDLNAYITTFDASQVINWACDQAGNYEWLVIATQRSERVFGEKPKLVDQWYFFDRQNFTLYESAVSDGTLNADDERIATVVEFGRHALADQNRVPVRKIELPAHLWLAYRVYLQVLDHLNQDNAFSWALKQANLAVPVIAGPYEDKPVLSETTYIHFEEPTTTLTFAEQSGNSFTHAAARIAALREEVYRQMHLQAQGRSSSASASQNSGYSKEMDMAPSKDVANAFGNILRGAIAGIAEDAALISGRTVDAEVTGLQSEDNGAIVDIAEGQAALDMNIPSPGFDTYVYSKTAARVMRQAPKEQQSEVQKEIADAPSRQELAAQQAKQQQADLGATFSKSLDSALFKSASKQTQQ